MQKGTKAEKNAGKNTFTKKVKTMYMDMHNTEDFIQLKFFGGAIKVEITKYTHDDDNVCLQVTACKETTNPKFKLQVFEEQSVSKNIWEE